jgi:hypothetical protein
MPHGVKLLTRDKHPVPVVPRVFPQSFVVAVAPGPLWLSDLEPAFSERFPWESRPEVAPDLWAGEMFEPA